MTPAHTTSLGTFSLSLAVKDLDASRAFYAKLGFQVIAGDPAKQHFVILRNGGATIGLFHGMFDRNIMTFNPGWDSACTPLAEFTDVRELQRRLSADGIEADVKVDASTTGPASFVITDPDGNRILVDQHV